MKLSLLGWTQEEIGTAVGLAQRSVADILAENPKTEKMLIEQLDRHDVRTVAEKQDLPELLVWSLGWTNEMIGNCFNLSESAIRQRFDAEIADLQKLLESKLKLKNPVDLSSDPEAPTLELLAWALKLKDEDDLNHRMKEAAGEAEKSDV